jgi:hypothetical protein
MFYVCCIPGENKNVRSHFGNIETEFMSPVNSAVQGQGKEEYIQTRYCS